MCDLNGAAVPTPSGLTTSLEPLRAAETFYRRARQRAAIRQIALVAFVAAPLLLYGEPKLAPLIAVVSAAWAILELVILRSRERAATVAGATCTEVYDTEFLGLSWNEVLVDRISPETVAHAASKSSIPSPADEGWYDADPSDNAGKQACQAESPRWTIEIQERFRSILIIALLGALTVGVVIALRDSLSVRDYAVRLAIPTIPAAMSVVDLILRHGRSLEEWRRIQRVVAAEPLPSTTRLREQQDLIYLARSNYPMVPRIIFRLSSRKLSHG